MYVDALVGTGNGAVDELSPAGVHVKSYTVQHGPYAITYASSNSEVYIANTGSGTVSALSSTITVTVGSGPNALAYSPASNDLYVANSAAGTVSVISSANTVTNTLTVGTNPDALVYDTSNHDIYVANRGSATVTPITSANVVGTAIGIGTSTGGPVALAFNPNNGYIYASDPAANLVSVINGATNALVATISVTSAPTTILFDGADNDVYVIESTGSAVAYISGTTVSGTISVSSSPTAMALDANTNNLYVISPASSVLSEIAVSTNTVTHTAGVSSALSVAWFPSPSIDQIAVTSSASSGTVFIFTASTLGSVGSVSVGSNPTAALVNDATGNLTVANNGSASATIVSGLDAVLGAVTVDAGPAALAMDGANGDIYVACYASGTVDVA